MDQNIANVIVVGRTGAGKSTLCNKMMQEEVFKVGTSLNSETQFVSTKTITWPNDSTIQVKLIDAPGFGDNRPEITAQQLLSNILSFIKSSEDGLHIVLFCFKVNSRFDSHDIQELELLGLLLGAGVYDHVYIVITQVDTLVPDEKEKIYKNYKKDLPNIIAQHALPPFPQERMLFVDSNNFDEFMQILTQEIRGAERYMPQIAREIDPNDPESIDRFLQAPEIKRVTEFYQKQTEEQIIKMTAMQDEFAKQKNKIEESKKDLLKKHQIIEQRMQHLNTELVTSNNANKALKTKHEEELRRQVKELDKVKNDLNLKDKRNKELENWSRDQAKQMQLLHEKMNNMQPQIIVEKRGCNLI